MTSLWKDELAALIEHDGPNLKPRAARPSAGKLMKCIFVYIKNYILCFVWMFVLSD